MKHLLSQVFQLTLILLVNYAYPLKFLLLFVYPEKSTIMAVIHQLILPYCLDKR